MIGMITRRMETVKPSQSKPNPATLPTWAVGASLISRYTKAGSLLSTRTTPMHKKSTFLSRWKMRFHKTTVRRTLAACWKLIWTNSVQKSLGSQGKIASKIFDTCED
ncbi:hypothetical protein TMatcc_009624 [Talaromyces marneffei ATCC 18224]